MFACPTWKNSISSLYLPELDVRLPDVEEFYLFAVFHLRHCWEECASILRAPFPQQPGQRLQQRVKGSRAIYITANIHIHISYTYIHTYSLSQQPGQRLQPRVKGSRAIYITANIQVIDRPQGSCGVWDIPKVLRGVAE